MSEWAAKRFWTQASVVGSPDGYGISLDGRPVRTPAKAPLVVPSDAMAQAIAAEWQAQGERIDPTAMPVTRAANAAIDKVAVQFDEVAAMLADYGGTDLLCYRAEGPEALVARQAAAWDPLLAWARETYGARLVVARGVMHVPQPRDSLDALTAAVRRRDVFELTALHEFVTLSGSLVIGLAADSGHLPARDLWKLSCVDETYQQELWGVDEEAQEANSLKEQAFVAARNFLELHRSAGIAR